MNHSVFIITPPPGKPVGWDLADAEQEGWTGDTIRAWVAECKRNALPTGGERLAPAAKTKLPLPELETGTAAELAALAGGSLMPAAPRPPRPKPADVDAAKAEQRKTWPPFEPPHDHPQAMEALARLRHVSVDGVKLMAARGLLYFAGLKDKPAFIVTDAARVNAQARRMDGRQWEGIAAKAQPLPGFCAAWPVGARESLAMPFVLLCEGVDILAAHHFIHAHGRTADTAAVAILGAPNSIHADALPLFARKRVRIMAHADEAGRVAAAKWKAQLDTVGAHVDAADFTGLLMADGTPAKDLNDLTRIDPKQAHELEDLIPR